MRPDYILVNLINRIKKQIYPLIITIVSKMRYTEKAFKQIFSVLIFLKFMQWIKVDEPQLYPVTI
jgi:hypothetical protein